MSPPPRRPRRCPIFSVKVCAQQPQNKAFSFFFSHSLDRTVAAALCFGYVRVLYPFVAAILLQILDLHRNKQYQQWRKLRRPIWLRNPPRMSSRTAGAEGLLRRTGAFHSPLLHVRRRPLKNMALTSLQ